ncbi:MAG TPA: hypothetical protein DEF65_07385 [Lachnospiraceae bacterium]|nr:hypothetical protein [Lachnospiraceae bacterium]
MKRFILFLCVDIRLISRMLYLLMEVLGDNIQRDEAKRNRAEEGVSGSAGGNMRCMAALRSITRGRLRVIFLLHVD